MDAFSFLRPTLPDSAGKSPEGHLVVGGVDMVSLATELGTPLYVYDSGHIEDRCRRYVEAFSTGIDPPGLVVYASKAFPSVAMCRLAARLGLGLDVAGPGELGAALEAGVDREKIYYHGNAKTPKEIASGIEAGVGRFVVDNFTELARIQEVVAERGFRRPQQVLIRITPGIEAHTHEFIKTGHEDSKFGFYVSDGSAEAAVKEVLASEALDLVGIHLHIGSQILDLEPFAEAARLAVRFADEIRRKYAVVLRELDLGGGLGATYLPDDGPPSIEDYAGVVKEAVREECSTRDLPVPRVVVEPGRSLVANAGLTLYSVQSLKTAPSGKTYVAVDGGMSDNLRPMLYGATYAALAASRLDEDHTSQVCLVGKHCESGDVLVEAAQLPASLDVGDLVAVPATGAYGWSMSSNYNGQPRPPVVFVKEGEAEIVVKGETPEDLLRLQR